MSYADDRQSSMDLPPSGVGSLYEHLLADPAAFGFARGLAEELLDALESDGVEDDEDRGDVRRGDPHDAHVSAYRHVKAREARAAALQRGVDDIRSHLDGSPGCMRLGVSTEFLHVRHLWAEEADIVALPYEAAEAPQLPAGKGYPHCSLPWAWWPPVVGAGSSALLHLFRIRRANALVTAQIAAAGGIDDDRGWIIDRTGYTFPQEVFGEWRRTLYLTPDECNTAKKTARKAKKAAHQRTARAQAKKAPTAPRGSTAGGVAVPPVGRSGKRTKRPIEVIGDHATVPLTRGYVARISASDVPLVEGYNWSVRIVEGRAPVAVRNAKGEDGKARNAFMHLIDGMAGPVEIIPPPSESLSLAA
ncbi:hypothetical protein V5F32_08380 [Xanthobacter oligotrophicus]|uniref:Uncharacterized protein n=1 Tax=Xanthobacter oligotrophicus TaxID=2607286 RepID=A0ABW6ZTW1_9HYPH